MIDAFNLPILDGDNTTPLWSGLADMPPLKAARKNYPGVCQNLFVGMHMAKCPIVVILGSQVIEFARCIVRVALSAIEAGVQQADIEEAWLRHRKTCSEIVHNVLLIKALPVYGNFKFFKNLCSSFSRRKECEVLGLL